MVILAILAGGVWAAWFLPPLVNEYARRKAAAYLRELTGGVVHVGSAKFTLFSGVELHDVSVDVPNSPPASRLFQAETVLLDHRPWGLLARGRLEPTELVCIGPEVMLEYDARRGRYYAEDLLAAAWRGRGSAALPAAGLPVISIRDVRLRLLTGELRLNISMIPAGRSYRITLAEESGGSQGPLRGTWRLDLASGRLELLESNIPRIAHTDSILPERYSRWRKRYAIRGEVSLRSIWPPPGGTSRPGGAAPSALEATLKDVSLRLLPQEGGLELKDVNGRLVFYDVPGRPDGNRVVAREIVGRIAQAGDARFRMSGTYGGYEPNSPFRLHLSVERMTIPEIGGAKGWLAERLVFLRRTFNPSGPVTIQADVERTAGGDIHISGTARPLGMSFTYRYFPYRLDEVTGTIEFASDSRRGQVAITEVTGRRNGATVRVHGWIDLHRKDFFDVSIDANDVVLDGRLRSAMPADLQRIWDRFAPAGRINATVRARRDGPARRERIEVTLRADGRLSASYAALPYRIEELTGLVRIDADNVAIELLRGRRGPMQCSIDGTVTGLDGNATRVDLAVEATNLPLDEHLVAALPASVRPLAASLHARGMARKVSALVRQEPGEALDYTVTSRIEDSAFRPDAFAYLVTGVGGTVTVRPGRVELDGVSGRHGRAT
ncbi:MAG: hypothetical protein J7M21_03260, partial [Planctomycetes bacterium]|nr:hypothetical protein [Planctomycetota bacterium]